MEFVNKIVDRAEKIIRTDVRYAFKGFFWLGTEYAVSTLTGLATSVAFANLLLPETYGLLKYVLSIFPLLGIATLTGIESSLTISVAKGFEGDILRALKTKLSWGLLGSSGGLFLGLYYWLAGDQTLALLIFISAIFVPLFNSPYVYTGFLQGKKKFKALSLLNSLSSIIYAAAIIITLILSKNIFVIVFSYFIVNTLIRFVMLLLILKTYRLNKNCEERTISYGKKFSLVDVIGIISGYIDNILVFHYLGAAELAAYIFIKKVPENFKQIPQILSFLSVPKFSSKHIGDPLIKKEVIRKTWIFYSSFALLIVGYIFLAPFIFQILFKPYSSSHNIFLSQIYAVSFAFNFGGLFLSFVETHRDTKKVVAMHTLTAAFTIIVVFVSLKFYGLLGLVIGYSITRFFSSLIRYTFFKIAK